MAAASGDDDCATVPVPASGRVGWTTPFFAALGMATALIYMQISAVITLQYGVGTALLTVGYSTITACAIAMVIARAAQTTGFGMNLMAKVLLGRRGSFLFSLLFGVTTLVYFIIEAHIMGAAIGEIFANLPMSFLLPVVAVSMIPMVWLGIRFLGKFQAATLILYVALMAAAILLSIGGASGSVAEAAPAAKAIGGSALVAAIGIMNGLVFVTALVTADFARFVRADSARTGIIWVGGIFQGIAFGAAGLIGIWFALRYQEANPGVFLVAALGGGGALLALATQLRINLANMYLGSIAFTNAFEEVTPLRPSRHLMVILFGVGAALALTLDITAYLEAALSIIGLFSLCFTVLVLVDILILHRERWTVGAADVGTEGLPRWRWPAVGSLVAASAFGNLCMGGAFGATAVQWATFAAALLQAALYILLSAAAPER